MITNRATVNPNIPKVAMELKKGDRLEYLSLIDGTNTGDGWIKLLAFVVIALAAIGTGAMGWIFATFAEAAPNTVTAVTLFCGGSVGALVGLFILDLLLNAGAASYEAEFSDVMKPTGRSFPQAAGTPGKRISLTEQDKQILQVFANRYNAVRSLGIENWEGRSSPLVFPFISKRNAIIRVQEIVVGLGYGVRDGRGGVKVTADFERRVIPDWQAGVFDDENKK